ncbi:putative smp-30 gluconolaconase lre-like region [Venturia nashicola]|uniref:Putative smp-30 gluconolaconase lre-like region n=1 Tax=Venturia nashicola TaxID=86259 RepID=A0A4Z1NSG2_9PEZI|nr:putative smp-30 gluconolaconase lre-like region [Venturia nashicola]TLD29404.1 putative smp-30 gluconolaconase lre-like region [Venturia nashicola]
MASVTTVDLLALATSLPYAAQINSFTNSTPGLSFVQYEDEFSSILGLNASWEKIANESFKAFHEAGVYHQKTGQLYMTSNYGGPSSPIVVTVLNMTDYSVTSEPYEGLAAGNGGSSYVAPGADGPPQVLFCDQGDNSSASGLSLLDPETKSFTPILNSYYGSVFNSINDVKQHYSTSDLWFTDASYGYLQKFRPEPSSPNQVYRFEPETGRVSAVTDGFSQSNGIEFSPDFKTLYVADTGAQMVTRYDALWPATIYAFDVVKKKYLRNKRVFTYIHDGIPDGVHTDTEGNVYAGVGDGVSVWNRYGVLIGKFRVDGGAANFAFVPGGIIIFNEYRLFLAKIAAVGREVARDFGS